MDDGLNRYGYVAGNPTTNTDPSGHKLWAGGDSGGGGSNTPPDCHVTHTCKTGGGGGGGGGGSCTHNCEPGCKGTIDQCNSWIQGRGALISDLQGNENGAWAVLGLVTGAMDIWDLVVDKGKGFITTLIDIVSIVGDALFTMNYALQFIQEKFGVDTTGLRHIVDMLSKFVNVIAGPLKAFRKGMNWLVQQVLNFSWDAFVTSFRISNVPGILMTVLSQFWGGFLEDIRNNVVEFAEHAVQGYVSAQEEQITNIQGQSIDAFCSAHRASCQGY